MNGPCLPILMYHSVTRSPPAATRNLSVTPEAFAAQLDVLGGLGATTLTFSEASNRLAAGMALPPRAVVLTFDDGYADFSEQVVPLLERHGATATVFVTTGWIGNGGVHAAGRPLDRMLTWAQVREVAAAGLEVGAHGHSHAQLDQLPDAELQAELRTSRALLEEGTGQPVRALAYPFGYSNRRVRAAVGAAGFRHAAAVANALAGLQADRLAIPRLTVRRSTTPETFERIVRGEAIGRTFLVDRALTRGWAVARRSRSLALRLRDHG
jgi:peptidoglycan/xylan/chitin deacetylase (PgdA/CDA1 family)